MERALAIRSDLPHYYSNLGNAYRFAGRRAEAVLMYRAALERNPASIPARVNLGNTLFEQGRLDDALAVYQECLALSPGQAEAHLGAGIVAQELGLIDDALASFTRAIDANPGLTKAQSGRLFALNLHPGYSPEEIAGEHRLWAARHADSLDNPRLSHINDRNPSRRLRIGYVSSHFRDHAVNFFIEPILANHDRAQFEVYCYSDVLQPDQVTRRLQSYTPAWRNIVGLSDSEVANRIRQDCIDIFVDLNGHMGENRLLVFARKPAPIQITYLGYQATTGIAAMDYRLTDAQADPPGKTDSWHTEKLIRLPCSYFCYRPPAESPEMVDPPCLKSGCVTFGSFNNFTKVTREMLSLWARILTAAPSARLKILAPESDLVRHRIIQLIGQRASRPTGSFSHCAGPRREYLEHYQSVDIALDPFPANGHTTTCDALWMGVPVVTRCGESYVQRYGSVPLREVDLHELVTDSDNAYVSTAVAWAADPRRLLSVRRSLRQRMRESVLLDEVGFTRTLEVAYRNVWQRWCRGEK